MNIISLGWGVQSTTLAFMAVFGDLDVDIYAAVHSDTTFERESTYRYAQKYTGFLVEHGLRVETVKAANHKLGQTAEVSIPAFTTFENNYGQIRRQCTNVWKIQPLRRWISNELIALGERKTPGRVNMYLGISIDEFARMRTSDVKYINHVYPLIDRRMSRRDCIEYLRSHGIEIPDKSSCVFCPYHNKLAWQDLKRRGGKDYQTALDVDEQIRDARPPQALYIHPARRPLAQAINLPEDEGAQQLNLFSTDPEQCDSGYCFL